MKILGIESSEKRASVALIEDNKTIDEIFSEGKETHSVTLMPMLDLMLKRNNLDIKDIDAYAVSVGPGSYTGLRIAVATVKGLNIVLDKPVMSISTLEAMAYNHKDDDFLLVPMLDARRGNVFSGIFKNFSNTEKETNKENTETKSLEIKNDIWKKDILKEDLYGIDYLLSLVGQLCNQLGKKALFMGSGAIANREIIQSSEIDGKFALDENELIPNASSVALLGLEYYKKNVYISGEELVPNYLRPSQAERNKKNG